MLVALWSKYNYVLNLLPHQFWWRCESMTSLSVLFLITLNWPICQLCPLIGSSSGFLGRSVSPRCLYRQVIRKMCWLQSPGKRGILPIHESWCACYHREFALWSFWFSSTPSIPIPERPPKVCIMLPASSAICWLTFSHENIFTRMDLQAGWELWIQESALLSASSSQAKWNSIQLWECSLAKHDFSSSGEIFF